MVKKHKGGRRQILQLEDKKPSRSESEPTSTATLSKEASPLDSQVADFFKEIDALTVNEKINEGTSKATFSPSEIASCSKQKESDDPESVDGLPEKSENSKAEETPKEVYCPWQEICDENTGYNYYWNVQTNEVTWDCPSEYTLYIKNFQTVEIDQLPQTNQPNSNDCQKKSKKKKEPPQPSEGAIIPISYFGSTSSEESSDEEKENGLDTTSKCYLKVKTNFSKEGIQKNVKKDDNIFNHIKKESPVKAIGPHLPQDNQFSKKVSSASRTSYLSKEPESSKNEVEEYFEIGPQLPSNSRVEVSRNSECNAVSDSSSTCNSISHSYKNGPTVASTTYDEPWEVSLMNIDRKFRGLDQDIGEESPDSTVRKGDTLPENNVPCQTSNDMCGLRGVVEYDNFTDEEEEMSSSNISSSKEESCHPSSRILSHAFMKPREKEDSYYGRRQVTNNRSEVSQSESQQSLPKRKLLGKIDEHEEFSFKKSKPKDKIDIDSLFNNNKYSNNKYGFGFSRQDQLNMESELFCSTSNQFGHSCVYKDYKTISFVKSDHVFDLNSTVNRNISSDDNSGQSTSRENEIIDDFDNESIYKPGPSGLNGIKDTNSKDTVSNSSYYQSNESDFKDTDFDETNTANQSYHNNKASYEQRESASGRKDVSSSRANGHFRAENTEDIDRNLLKLLDAKKTEDLVSKPTSSSNKKCETDSSSSSKRTNIECAKSVAKSGNLTEDIVNLSSILIEKLTFLISNHSTLASLSSLLIQIQTRLMDWQAAALESKYFMARLLEVQQYLQHYEVGAVSGDWTCQWDRENKRYFYVNTRTQQSQWTYPDELCGKENSWIPSSTDIASTSTASSEIMIEHDELQTVSSSVPEGQLHKSSATFTAESSKGNSDKYSNSSAMWLSESSPPPPPPGVDSPPPPPPQSPPPDSPPPPPPDSTEVEDCLEDMDIENSDDSNPPLIVTNSRVDSPTDSHMQFPKFAIPSPERSCENFTSASVTNAVSSTSLSGFEDMNIVTKSAQMVSTSRDTFDNADSVNMHWSMSQPSCSTDVASHFDCESEAVDLLDPKSLSFEKDFDMSASSSSRSYICSNEVSTYHQPSSSYPSTSSSSSSSTARKEKKKTKLSSGLALKKKNIPSLVEKWQKIKEEQEKENKKDRDSKDPGN